MAKSEQGFTLIELMTVMVIMGMISIYVGQILIVTDRAYHTVDQTTASQQSLRVVLDILERDIRHAGLMTPGFASVCGVDNTNGPDWLYLSDGDAIDPDDDVDPYPGALVVAGTLGLGNGTFTLQLDSLSIETAPRPFYDTDGNGVNDSDFQPNAGVIFADATDHDRGTVCGQIQSVNLANNTITFSITSTITNGAAPGQLIAVPAHEYRIDGTQLIWDGHALAEGIEDFQVAYVFDLNDNDLIDPGETRGDGVGANYTSEELAADDLRQIRVSVVARSRLPDPKFASGRLQPVENRQAVGTADGYRRRILSTQLRLRNVGPGIGVI